MSSIKARYSKFNHVFGPQQGQKITNWPEVPASRAAHTSEFMSCSATHLGVVLEARGGGAFGVVPLGKNGRWTDPKSPVETVVNGHTREVLEIRFSPHFDDVIASLADDMTCKLWKIPAEGHEVTSPLTTLSGQHARKPTVLEWHPFASNLIVTGASDAKLVLWDVEAGAPTSYPELTSDPLQGMWSLDGKLFAAVCKDKMARVWDFRKSGKNATHEFNTQESKGRMCWGPGDFLITAGVNSQKRQPKLFQLAKGNNSEPVDTIGNLGDGGGVPYPYFDEDNSMVYIAGKGEASIKYWEFAEDKGKYFQELKSLWSSTQSMRGICMAPKRILDVSNFEIARFYKIWTDSAGKASIDQVALSVPRKSSDVFDTEIYPPAFSGEASGTAKEWMDGGDLKKKTVQLDKSYDPSKFKKEAPAYKEVKTEAKAKTAVELQKENEELQKRVAFLEHELLQLKK